jgi:anaerobic magnesium-protoporphyrin IX monomethyl ester cyclase
MNIALIIPAWSPEEIFSAKTSGSQINYWQPLGTLYVASALRQAGHNVTFLNGAFIDHAQIMRELKSFAPQAVGIYSTTFGWDKALFTSGEIKRWNPSVFTFTGGPYPIAVKEQCLKDGGNFDAVVTGEGELTCVEMVDALEDNKTLKDVSGLIYNDNGEIVSNPPRAFIEDMDSIPFPARDLLGDPTQYIPPPATYRQKPVAVVITSRGCNRNCLYCFQIDRKRTLGIRYRSVDNVMAELELCKEQGYREIKFIDDTLAADYDRAMELVTRMKDKKLGFTWFASACVNQVDKPLLKAFREAGCWAILFGAESGVQKNLNTIRKGIKLDQTRAAVKAAQEVGIKVFTPFLFGIPGETYEEALETINFAIELNPDVANFHAITPFPGTDLYDDIDKYGTMSEELLDFTYQGIAFTPRTMTREQIAELRQLAFRRFYSRPSFLLRRLLGLRTLVDVKAAYFGLTSLLWMFFKRGVFKRDGEDKD